jgi:flagellar motor switch protein FliG
MFVFENISTLDDRSIQRILREVEVRDLGLALKATPDEVKDAIIRNMSSRAGAMLREDMEATGPVRLRQVEEAQSRIVEVIRRLDDAEEIVIARGGDDELVT